MRGAHRGRFGKLASLGGNRISGSLRRHPEVAVQIYVGILLAFEGPWREGGVEEIWRRVAFATRYGHIGLAEALTMPVRDLALYGRALADLIESENTPSPGAG